MVTIGLLLILIVLIIGAVAVASSNVIQIAVQSKQTNYHKDYSEEDGLPSRQVHQLKKGMDILLKGASKNKFTEVHTSRYALQPFNFHNIAPIPKVVVEDGGEVLAGDPLFYDKQHPDVFFVSPVSGEMAGIVRGAKRAVNQVIVLADREIKYKKLNSPDLKSSDRLTIREFLKKNGGWPLFRQRPFNILPDNEGDPRDIFISTFDTAPLAGAMSAKIDGRYEAIQKGVEVLHKLTDGKVYMGIDGRKDAELPRELTEINGVEYHAFDGPHPCGNVGVQIHHIDYIKKGDIVWTIGVQELITLGNMFLLDIYDAQRVINISGNAAHDPHYVKTYLGADLSEIVPESFDDPGIRVISGHVLHGNKKGENPFLDFYTQQVTIIPEGDQYEMFGWLVPQSMRPSASHTYPNFLFKDMKYNVDTNKHGEKRAFVMTGQYEEVLPVDTYPQQFFKGIVTQDIDRMEGLGIYELVEEDVALCEFVCTSKQPLQRILREGLDYMQYEA
ncbi:Na(+)-translocating NADH-quinone reductase subunit A [Membranicola marinus]|uniref:Na(+)-translocating NADH-quinone reductase subunit A n=2 Tax=Membranihabitans marinus TaxID=1227546 RepID=A0A953L641_9BACT|nr:Na(+)-translocating NADH-quinone reductase subunit A [Membranihabitans marinus]